MKKRFSELFHTPTQGKISERFILTRLISAVAVVLVCLTVMGVTAFAYFSHSVTSSYNTVRSAIFETSVVLRLTDENGEEVSLTKLGQNFSATLADTEGWTAVWHVTKGNNQILLCLEIFNGMLACKVHI